LKACTEAFSEAIFHTNETAVDSILADIYVHHMVCLQYQSVVSLLTVCCVNFTYLMLVAGCPPLSISPLYAALPPSQQLKAFGPAPKV